MMLSWRLGGMAAMVPDAVNATEGDNVTDTEADTDVDAMNATDAEARLSSASEHSSLLCSVLSPQTHLHDHTRTHTP